MTKNFNVRAFRREMRLKPIKREMKDMFAYLRKLGASALIAGAFIFTLSAPFFLAGLV